MIRRCFALLFAFWLPLQGLAAVAMPFCAGIEAPAAADQAPGHGPQHDRHDVRHDGHDHGHDHGGRAGDDAGHAGLDFSGCDRCGLCHMACAYPVPAVAAALSFDLQAVLVAAREPHIADNPLEPFQIPPLARRA